MKKIKCYTAKMPAELRDKTVSCLGDGPRKNATYGDLLDYLFDKGYVIELVPFYTFALVGNVGYVLKVFKIDIKHGAGKYIYDEEKEFDGTSGYGGSFRLQMDRAIDIIIKDFNDEKGI